MFIYLQCVPKLSKAAAVKEKCLAQVTTNTGLSVFFAEKKLYSTVTSLNHTKLDCDLQRGNDENMDQPGLDQAWEMTTVAAVSF